MKKFYLFFMLNFVFIPTVFLQVVGIGESSDLNPNAALHVTSDSKGVLLPKLTSAIITSYEGTLGASDVGMVVFNLETNQYMYFKSVDAGFVNMSSLLIDGDGDTYVAVEEEVDNDKIHFVTAGKTALMIERNDFGGSVFNTRYVQGSSNGLAQNLLFGNQLPTGSGGIGNTYFGNRSVDVEIQGGNSVAVGYDAISTGKGIANVAVGNSALKSNDTGFNNVAVGNLSMMNTTSGFANVGVGAKSLAFLTTGTTNVAIGESALTSITTNYGNVALGTSALAELVSGDQNTTMGHLAMANLSNGSNNVAIGELSGFLVLSSATVRSHNTYIGTRAGFNATGSNNIFIGSSSGENFTGSYEFAVGDGIFGGMFMYGDLLNKKLAINWDPATPIPANLAVNGTVHISQTLQLEPLTVEPTCDAASEGKLYYNGTDKIVKVCNGTVWLDMN